MDAPSAADTTAAATPARAAAPMPRDLAGVISHADALAADGRLHEAVEIYRNILRRHPRILGVHFNLGVALLRHQRGAEAVAHFDTLLRAADCPAWLIPRARQALALALEQSGDAAAAAAEYRRLLTLEPANFAVQRQLATLYRDLGLPERALEAFERCAQLWPTHCGVALDRAHLQLQVLDWAALPSDEGQHALALACQALPDGVEPPAPHALLDLPADIGEAQIGIVAAAHARFIERSIGTRPPAVPPAPRTGRRLRLAYATHDVLGAQGAWVRTLLRHHDRQRFELVLYTWSPSDGSPEREQSLLDAEHAVDVAGLSEAALAQRLQLDAIDVLLDPGCTPGTSRPGLFARRPAPLQLAWLGDPLAAWSGWYDGLVCDAVQLQLAAPTPAQQSPAPADALGDTTVPVIDGPYPSPLVILPGCARVLLEDLSPTAEPTSRSALGLPTRAPVLALLAEPATIDEAFFHRCLGLAQLVPGTALWLRDPGTRARQRLSAHVTQWLQAHPGSTPPSLVFLPQGGSMQDLPALVRYADLVLDTGREVGAPLVMASLASGVPALTLQRPNRAQGAAASLLAASLGAHAVCQDLIDFEAKARQLITHPRELLAWRRRLSDWSLTASLLPGAAHPPLWHPRRTVQALETAIDQFWHQRIETSS